MIENYQIEDRTWKNDVFIIKTTKDLIHICEYD